MIPSFFAGFSNLTELRLEGNRLTGGADNVCPVEPAIFSTDCLTSELVCECCSECCSGSRGSCVPGNGLPPANDECSDTSQVLTVGATEGSTRFANADVNSGSCSGVVSVHGGVWFRVIGNGQSLTATVCGESVSFEPQLSVFRGGCGVLECVTATNEGCPQQNSGLSWSTVEDEEYRLLVHGFGQTQGEFTLSITQEL